MTKHLQIIRQSNLPIGNGIWRPIILKKWAYCILVLCVRRW
nr:MAG TPA: hypothetical protein [Caudoviricetes sp.]